MFDYLKNAYNTVKSTVANVFNTPLPKPTTQTASVMQFPVGQGLNPVQKAVAENTVKGTATPEQAKISVGSTVNQNKYTVNPNISTVAGPALAQGNQFIYNSPNGAVSVPQSNVNAFSTPYIPNVTATPPTPRPASVSAQSLVTPQASQYNLDWFTPTGIPLMSKGGTPIRGELGAQGLSSVNLGASNSSPIIGGNRGTQGLNGNVDPRFSIGAGPLGQYQASATGLQDQENQPKKSALAGFAYNPQTGQLYDPKAQIPAPVVTPLSKSQAAMATLPTVANEAPMQIPSVPSTFDASSAQDYNKRISDFMQSPAANNINDLQTVLDNTNRYLQRYQQEQQRKNPIPENVIVETPQQSDFLSQLEQSQPDYAQQMRSFMDQWKVSNGVPQWESQRLETLNNLTALNKALKDAMTDIKNDPNLPKALATRRIEAVKEQYAGTIDTLEGTLKQINAQLDTFNSALDKEIGIQNTAFNARLSQRKTDLDMLQTFIDAGVEFSPEEATAWGKKLGVSAGSIMSLQRKTAGKDVALIEDRGITTAVDKLTGQPLWQANSRKEISDGSGLSAGQKSMVNNAINANIKFEESVIPRAQGLQNVVNQIKKNPSSASQQLNLMYQYIKALDTDSAVREGETALLRETLNSTLQNVELAVQKVTKGQPIGVAAANEIAGGAQTLINNIYQSVEWNRQRRRAQVSAQGPSAIEMFDTYSANSPIPKSTSVGTQDISSAWDESSAPQQASGGFWSNFMSSLLGK